MPTCSNCLDWFPFDKEKGQEVPGQLMRHSQVTCPRCLFEERLKTAAQTVIRVWDQNRHRLSEGNPERAELVEDAIETLRKALS